MSHICTYVFMHLFIVTLRTRDVYCALLKQLSIFLTAMIVKLRRCDESDVDGDEKQLIKFPGLSSYICQNILITKNIME